MNIKKIIFITFSLFCIACGNDAEDNNANLGQQDNGDLVLQYVPPTSDGGKTYESAFKKALFFETVLEIVNREYALPKDIPVKLAECGTVNAFWNPTEEAITMCYELFDDIVVTFANGTNWTNEEIFQRGRHVSLDFLSRTGAHDDHDL